MNENYRNCFTLLVSFIQNNHTRATDSGSKAAGYCLGLVRLRLNRWPDLAGAQEITWLGIKSEMVRGWTHVSHVVSHIFFFFFCICMCENRGGFQWEMNISVRMENNVLKLNSSCNYYEAIIKEYILELRSILYIINKAYLNSKFCVNR